MIMPNSTPYGGWSQHLGHRLFTRYSKLEFPRFSRSGFKYWWYKADQYFLADGVDTYQKVVITALHLDDIAIQWQHDYIRSWQHIPFPTWKEYIYSLSDSFGAMYEDPMGELVNLKQTGSVIEFQEDFNRIMTQLNLLVDNAISVFLAKLKLELGDAVRIHKPYSLSQAYHLARLYESIFKKQSKAMKSSSTSFLYSYQKTHLNSPPYTIPKTNITPAIWCHPNLYH